MDATETDINGTSRPQENGCDMGAYEWKSSVIVAIDIKPGTVPNTINLGSGGTVPVAIFSSTTFDATTIDPETLTLESAPVKLKGKDTWLAVAQDVDGDGLLDLVVHFVTES